MHATGDVWELAAAVNAGELAAPWSLAARQTGLGVVPAPVHELPWSEAELAAGRRTWVFFADKGVLDASAYQEAIAALARQSEPRQLERRSLRRSLPGRLDGHDLPLNPADLRAIVATGAEIVVESRWFNAISVRADQAQLAAIAALPRVRELRPVRARAPRRPGGNRLRLAGDETAPFYGLAWTQLEQINLPGLHSRGHTGAGVVIGVLDTGFRRDHAAFNHPGHTLEVIAEWDFLDGDGDTGPEPGDHPQQHEHGTYILASMAAYAPGSYVGGAYDAAYVLAKVEDVADEYAAEEDMFVAGLEFLESMGADLATSSLVARWYVQDQLDGQTSLMTQAFNLATANGMHCFQGAGNDGHDADPLTSHLLAPADAFDVITCGAIDVNDVIAGFSSDGPTADGRVKPELLARGAQAWTVVSNGTDGYTQVSGTSISTPMVCAAAACIVQAHPDWPVGLMRQRLFETADYFVAHGTHDPLFVLGYGIVDAVAAESGATGTPEIGPGRAGVFPNPFRDRTTIRFGLAAPATARLSVYDVSGRRILTREAFLHAGEATLGFEARGLANGVYAFRVEAGGRLVASGRMLHLR